MAKTIKPQAPMAITSVDVKVPDMDFSIFDKLGDEKVKNATQNFRLFATTAANAEAQKAYDQYKTNPIALANALKKISGIYDDLPESVRAELEPKMNATAVSLIKKAQANQQAAYAKENKIMAHTDAGLLMKQQAEDVFNVLSDMTTPEGQRDQAVREIYDLHRASLTALAGLKDENGNPLFNESQQAKMLMPKEAAVAGFKSFIYRPDLKQLEEWDEKVFQNRDKFKKDLGIDDATYDAMEKVLTARIKQLKDTDTRKIKTQAAIETAELLKSGDEMKAKILEENPDAPKALVKKAVQINKEILNDKWYDPKKESDPSGLLGALAEMNSIVENVDDSPDGIIKMTEAGIKVIDNAKNAAREVNMSESDLSMIRDSVADSITNTAFRDGLKQSGLTQWLSNIWRARSYNSLPFDPFFGLVMAEGAAKISQSRKRANTNAEKAIKEAIITYKNTGNQNMLLDMVKGAKYNYVKDLNEYWVPNSDFDRLQSEFESGKEPKYFHNGILYKYNGIQGDKAIFEATL